MTRIDSNAGNAFPPAPDEASEVDSARPSTNPPSNPDGGAAFAAVRRPIEPLDHASAQLVVESYVRDLQRANAHIRAIGTAIAANANVDYEDARRATTLARQLAAPGKVDGLLSASAALCRERTAESDALLGELHDRLGELEALGRQFAIFGFEARIDGRLRTAVVAGISSADRRDAAERAEREGRFELAAAWYRRLVALHDRPEDRDAHARCLALARPAPPSEPAAELLGACLDRGRALVSTEVSAAADAVAKQMASDDVGWRETAGAAQLIQEMTALREGLLATAELDHASAQALASSFSIAQPLLADPGRDAVRTELAELLRWLGPRFGAAIDGAIAERPRAAWVPAERVLDLGAKHGAIKHNIFHEGAHAFEAAQPRLTAIAHAWITSRAEGAPRALRELVPGTNYDHAERAYPDRFIHPYVGRHYEQGWTEVLAMGLERFVTAEHMADLFLKDREHFFLVLGMIRP